MAKPKAAKEAECIPQLITKAEQKEALQRLVKSNEEGLEPDPSDIIIKMFFEMHSNKPMFSDPKDLLKCL